MKFPGKEVKCPICSETYNQINSVNVFKADQEETSTTAYTIYGDNKQMVQIANVRTPNRNRGISVLMDMQGECGHSWGHYMAFHKGMVYCNDYLTQSEVDEDFKGTNKQN